MPAFDKDFVLDNIHQNIDDLRYSLTDKIDGNKISSISKLPTKVIILCFSLQHRAVELAENSIKLFDQEHYLSSAILTRSLMETTALVFVTHKKVAKAVESQSLDELDDYLMRGIYGGKRDEDEFQSYNALTAIKHTAKKHEEYQDMYDELSEFAHPNWEGAAGLFSKRINESEFEFGKNINAKEIEIVLLPLLTSSTLLLKTFIELKDVFADFIELAENELS